MLSVPLVTASDVPGAGADTATPPAQKLFNGTLRTGNKRQERVSDPAQGEASGTLGTEKAFIGRGGSSAARRDAHRRPRALPRAQGAGRRRRSRCRRPPGSEGAQQSPASSSSEKGVPPDRVSAAPSGAEHGSRASRGRHHGPVKRSLSVALPPLSGPGAAPHDPHLAGGSGRLSGAVM